MSEANEGASFFKSGIGRGKLLRSVIEHKTPSPRPEQRSFKESSFSFANLKKNFCDISEDEEENVKIQKTKRYTAPLNRLNHSASAHGVSQYFSDNDSSESSYDFEVRNKSHDSMNGTQILQEEINNISYEDDSHKEEKLTSDYTIGQMLNRMENSCGIIHGNIKCKPVSSVYDLQLHPTVYSVLSKKNIKDLTRSQMYGIPVLLQRRNLILVGPPTSGKTFATVIAMSSLLFNSDYYKELPSGNGPLCVFLTSNSQHVKEIGLQCSIVTNDELQVITAYGGGLEKERAVNLTNGCDILVTTPRCWLRLLQSQLVTDMKRLAHVVFDDSDVLMTTLTDEVKKLLVCFRKLLERRKQNNCPVGLHIAVVGEKWTRYHDDCLTVIQNPVVSITSHLEAALYSRIKPITHIVSSARKKQKLIDLMEKSKAYKTVIMCSSEEEVITLRNFLPYGDDKILIAYEGMGYSSVCDTCQKWEEMSYNFIICSDAKLGELAITNAQHLIHFSLPANKSYFSERFSTIQEYFNDRVKMSKEGPVQCWVNILLDDENVKQFPEIISFIERFNTQIPQTIRQIVKNIRKQKEMAKASAQCCENLFMSGSCKNINKCTSRHIFLKEEDTPKGIPRFGLVKMQLLYIHNPSHYSVRILAQKIKEDDVWEDFKTNYGKIALKLANYYCDENKRIPHGKVNVGDMVCVEVELRTLFKRGIVTEILKRNEKGHPTTVYVHLIDEGSIKKYKAATLLHLPSELKSYKPEAYDVYVCDMQPIDYDPRWSTASTAKLQAAFREAISNVDDYFFIARVVLTIGRNMISSSFLCYEWLKSNKCYRVLFSPRNFMLSSKLAETNEEHLSRLMSLAKEAGLAVENPIGKRKEEMVNQNLQVNSKEPPQYRHEEKASVVLDKSLEKTVKEMVLEKPHEENKVQNEDPSLEDKNCKVEEEESWEWALLEQDEVFVANLTCCVSPGLFYLKLLKNDKRLNLLENKLSSILNKNIFKPEKIILDMACACINPAVNKWNRAIVLEIYDDNKVEILFVDYGDTSIVPVSGISLLPSGFAQHLPFQAIECSLVGINPSGANTDWDTESTDFFYSLTIEDPDKLKDLHARVCEITESENVIGTHNNHYKVLLFDFSAEILLNKELVISTYANWANDSTKMYITNKTYLQSMKDYKYESNVDLNQNTEELSEDEAASSNYVQNTMECLSEDDESDEPVDGAFSNSVWTDEMCTDPERINMVSEMLNKNKSDAVPLNNVIDILSNKEFEVVCSLDSLRHFSKDVVNYLPKPLKNMLKGEKMANTIEGPSGCKNEESSSSGPEPASSESSSEETKQDISSEEESTENCRNSNSPADPHEFLIHFDNLLSEIMGRELKVFKPPVSWSQTDLSLKISVDVPDIKSYLIYTDFQVVIFKCVVNEKIYAFDLKLFGPVCKEKTEYSLHGQCFEIKMTKVVPGEWPRLVYERNSPKGSWIKANADSLVPKKKCGIIEYFIERGTTMEETPEEYERRMQLRRMDKINPYANIPEIDSDIESKGDFDREDETALSDNDDDDFNDYD